MSGEGNIEEKGKQVYDLLFLLNKKTRKYIFIKRVLVYGI